MKQLYLDSSSYDVIATTDYQLKLATDAEALSQRIENRLSTFLGEWFLDNTIGVPYFDQVLIKQVDPTNVNALLLTIVQDTPEVEEVLSFSGDFDTATREYVFSFTVRGSSAIIASGSVST